MKKNLLTRIIASLIISLMIMSNLCIEVFASDVVTIQEADTQAPKIPANLRQTGKTDTSVTVAWDASTDNVKVTGYEVYRNGVKVGITPATAYTIIPLSIGKSYTITIKAYDAAGNVSDFSAPLTASTNSDTTPPTVPTALQLVSATTTSVSISWSASTDNVSVKGYDIYRDGVKIGTTPGLTYSLGSLRPNMTYKITLKAYDATGNMSNASDVLLAPTLSDTIPPSTPTNLTATTIGAGSATLQWTASTDNIGIKLYEIYRDGVKLSTSTTNSFVSTYLTPLTTYTYKVVAVDLGNNVSPESQSITITTTADTEAPSIPVTFRQTAKTDNSVTIEWDASTDNVKVAGYEVYRNGVKIGTTPVASFVASPLWIQTNYTFTLKAYDAYGNISGLSAPFVASTNDDTKAPTVPTNLVATGADYSSISLSWTASTDNNRVSEYQIFRNDVLVGKTSSTVYTNTNLKTGTVTGTSYTFTVKAVDPSGNVSDASVALIASTVADSEPPTTPQDFVATTVTHTSSVLVWSPSTDNYRVRCYEIWRDGVRVARVKAPKTTYTDITLIPGTTYSYTIKANDIPGNGSPFSEPITITTLPDEEAPTTPTNLRQTGKSDTSITLDWDESNDDVKVAQYEIYRNGVLVGKTSGTTFTVAPLTIGTSYTFTVKAFDLVNHSSDMSESVEASTNTDTTAPTAPTGLNQTSSTETEIAIAWTASKDNSWVKGYEVYRNGVKIGSTPGTSFTAGSLKPSSTYIFTVRAYDSVGNYSEFSAELSTTTADVVVQPQIAIELPITDTTEIVDPSTTTEDTTTVDTTTETTTEDTTTVEPNTETTTEDSTTVEPSTETTTEDTTIVEPSTETTTEDTTTVESSTETTTTENATIVEPSTDNSVTEDSSTETTTDDSSTTQE